ncbi:cysteine protease, putative [Medicago truncatula]|uniref:Cysteine protease, putative n=1 Tax=Medicago truncatula TaxID=3880 RepID=G7JD68_MEDTR|nr:cysteine protease, putative [Medicago truncatula]
MTIFMSPEYSCLQICNVDDTKVIVIGRICTCSKLIFQPESNKHRTSTGNKNTPHKDEKSKQSESFTEDEITKTNERKQKICESLIQL